MKSIRDVVHRMPESRSELEEYVLASNSRISEAVRTSPEIRDLFYRESEDTFDQYGRYLGGLAQKVASAGRAVGHSADAWLMTGDIVGSLGGKFIHLLAQIPEKAYSVVYGVRTGNYVDSLKNIGEGILSYLPGFTILDEGLARIVQKRMIKNLTYRMEAAIGERKSWYKRAEERARSAGYSDVRDRSENIIRVDFRPRKLKEAA